MIGAAIDAFLSTLTVHRATVSTTYVDGIAQPVTTWDDYEIIPISVQPLSAQERLLLPELTRDQETLKAYTGCELRTVDVDDKVPADRVTYKEQRYVVQAVEDWTTHGGFWKVVLVKEND